MSSRVQALILAGGAGTRLNVLARERAKPAVPFGGIYRIIDFTLSNVMNAGYGGVGVLTQYMPRSLMDHLGEGTSWDFPPGFGGVQILPPHTGQKGSDWYKGTADAIYQNRRFVASYGADYVMILSGDHIYNMDYRKMVEAHRKAGAAVTVAAMEVPIETAHRFGLVKVDKDGYVMEFLEKPKVPPTNLVSMGIYVFNRKTLLEELDRLVANGGDDFGKHLFPDLVKRVPVLCHRFNGYWRDVGTVQSYWDAHQDLLGPEPVFNLARWNVRTNLTARGLLEKGPVRMGKAAQVNRSMLARGCVIEGNVEDSVLSPGVRVEPGAVVRRSVLMHDCVVQAGAIVDRVVSDKDAVFGAGSQVGGVGANVPNANYPGHLDSGLCLIGKGAVIPAGQVVEQNALIFPYAVPDDYRGKTTQAGSTVGTEEQSA